MKNKYVIEIKNEETLLEFFKRCCDENGYNVSKVVSYLEYIDNYLKTKIDANSQTVAVDEDLTLEIFEFGNYFAQEYGEETKEKRFQKFGVSDSFTLQLFFSIMEQSCMEDFEESYEELSTIEKRKFDRICEQLNSLSGNKCYMFLEVDKDTEEDLPPIVVYDYMDDDKEKKREISNILKMELLDFYTFKGVLFCVLEKNEKELIKGECKYAIFGIAFKDKEIGLITAKKMLMSFSSISANCKDSMFFNDDDEVEFVDADLYVNPLGMPRNEYNKLGERLPNRMGRKMNDKIVSFGDVISRRKK